MFFTFLLSVNTPRCPHYATLERGYPFCLEQVRCTDPACSFCPFYFLPPYRLSLRPARLISPNFILILADDLGYGDLGITGSKQIPTPHIESLAASGVRFTNAYVTSSVCVPLRLGPD